MSTMYIWKDLEASFVKAFELTTYKEEYDIELLSCFIFEKYKYISLSLYYEPNANKIIKNIPSLVV